MHYNYYFEISALVFLSFIAIRYFKSKRFKSDVNSAFSIALIVSLCDIALDICGSICIDNINSVPSLVTYLVNGLFFCCHVLIPVLMLNYVCLSAGYNYQKSKWLIWLMIPAAIFIGFLLINPLTNLVFTISGEAGNLEYISGPLIVVYYIGAFFYLACVVFFSFVYRKKLKNRQFYTFLIFTAIVICALIIQFAFLPNILLTGTAIALSFMLVLFTIQNPEDMRDAVSNTFNYNAFVAYLLNPKVSKKQLKMVVIDIRGIGPVNRAMGLNIGNDLIKEVGVFLKSIKHDWLFRIISSRFLLVVNSEEEGRLAVDQVNERFSSSWRIGNNCFDLECDAQFFTTPNNYDSPSDLLMFIDLTYENNKFDKFHTDILTNKNFLEQLSRNKMVEEALNDGIKDDSQFYLMYQPIYKSDTRHLVFGEALLRFNSKKLGPLSPGEFIPIAEKCGLAPEIDMIVLHKALKFLKDNPQIKMLEINLSAAEFFENPADKITDLVKSYGVDANRICFEITETAASKFPDLVKACMEKMIYRGFSFACDDFGTGYANITQIVNLPFSIVKLDRILLQDDLKSRLLLGSLLDTFNKLNLQIITEGVETIQEYTFVNDLHSTFIQGYLFSKPVSEEKFIEMYNSRKEGADF